MSPHRQAFTLLELLVVITVIAVLASMILAVVPMLNKRAKIAATSQRMDALLMGLGAVQEEGSIAYRLQQDAKLGGVLTYTTDNNGVSYFKDGTLLAQFPNPVPPSAYLVHPWGKAYQKTTGTGWLGPDLMLLSKLSPLRTMELLLASGVVRDINDYKTKRSPRENWNDRWGNPLVVGCAFYQPNQPRLLNWQGKAFDATKPISKNNDIGLKQALADYQYARCVYVSVAAGGPLIPEPGTPMLPTSGTATDAQWFGNATSSTWFDYTPGNALSGPTAPTQDCIVARIWDLANQVCQAGGKTWNETGFDNPPWQGVRSADVTVAGGVRVTCLLSSVKEFK